MVRPGNGSRISLDNPALIFVERITPARSIWRAQTIHSKSAKGTWGKPRTALQNRAPSANSLGNRVLPVIWLRGATDRLRQRETSL